MKTLTLRRVAFTAVLLLGPTSVVDHSLTIGRAKRTGDQQAVPSPALSRPQADSVQALLDQGQELLRAKKYDEAVEVLQRAVQMQPDSTYAHVQLGIALINLGRAEKALAVLNQAVHLSPNDAGAYNELGNANTVLHRYSEAIEAYQQSVRLNPENCLAPYQNLGRTYGTISRFNESAEAYKQVLRMAPQNADAHNGLGIALYWTGHHEEGIAELKKAIQLRPNFVNAYLNLARSYSALGRYKESAEAFTPVTQIVPKFPTAYFERSVDYMYLGRGEEAANDSRTFLELNDWHRDRAPYMVIFAVLGYRQAGKEVEATRILTLAAKRCDTTVWPYPIISYLSREIRAEDLLRMATDRDKLTEAHAYIGIDLLLTAHRDEALEHLRWVSENGNRTFIEYTLARMELKRQGIDVAETSNR